ncbi:unnamed protein product [Rotaria socialis]|uniref:Uncharacterized protein n=1 Tax=Rotaria socialis TaxID=392032 RepID=A0A820U7S1_9BILA|nr:unnamed protein product [Rotaria socialis]
MSGAFSSVVNFTTDQFLKRAGESYSSNDESDKELETKVNSSSTSGDDSSEDENDLPGISSSGKHQFNGMRVTDTISPSLTNS